ncbi:MAG: hypothetical protein UX97_C0019G0003 [Candidatus Beckwithbacteria bacterium GW2011_GWA2_47_25]|nr:MAG: hypothetical protein UX97_C0019G0003 [Candidatus Beckwithbacteria bacterium GW2011_GWA2_47_25]
MKAIGAVTFTLTDWLVVPPVPVQESVKVEFAVRLPVDCDPEVDLVPDQAPEAVQEVTLVEDHVRVEAVPDVIEVGLAVRETVGTGLVVPDPLTCQTVITGQSLSPNCSTTNSRRVLGSHATPPGLPLFALWNGVVYVHTLYGMTFHGLICPFFEAIKSLTSYAHIWLT